MGKEIIEDAIRAVFDMHSNINLLNQLGEEL